MYQNCISGQNSNSRGIGTIFAKKDISLADPPNFQILIFGINGIKIKWSIGIPENFIILLLDKNRNINIIFIIFFKANGCKESKLGKTISSSHLNYNPVMKTCHLAM